MKPLPTLWILSGLGFLALGCQAGRFQWSSSSANPQFQSANYSDTQGSYGQTVMTSAEIEEPAAPMNPNVRPVKVPIVANCLPGSECVARLKYHARAASAYNRCRKVTGRSSRDFQVGFEQGYIDLSRGGLGRTPATAPHKYWGPAYRNPEGSIRQQEWLAGYTAGTQMAWEDGLGQFYPVSPNPDAQFYRDDTPSWARPR